MKITLQQVDEGVLVSTIRIGEAFIDPGQKAFFMRTNAPVEVRDYVSAVDLTTGRCHSFRHDFKVTPVELEPVKAILCLPPLSVRLERTGTSS